MTDEQILKVENIVVTYDESRGEYKYTGTCPICGGILHADQHGVDEECCGEYLEWDFHIPTLAEQQEETDDFMEFIDWEDEEW